jgi:uncharacterized membrane-anchored protein
MKTILFLLTILSSGFGYSQVISGSLVLSGRVRTDSTSLTIPDKHQGVVFVDIAVDRTGKVTGSRIHGEGTTIDSEQTLIRAAVLAKQLTFTPGTRYAKFEHALVKFTFVKDEDEWVEEKEEE